jgi:hypothetical protein
MMNRRASLLLCWNLLIFTTLGFSLDDKGLSSNLEVSLPTQGSYGLDFSVTNNNLGNNYWVDPVSNDLMSYSQVGLGGKYYLTNLMRISATIEAFFNSWTFANKDQESLFGGALAAEFDYIFISSAPIDFYAGPVAEIAFSSGSYTSNSNSITTTFSGQTYTFGGIVGAEYFFHSQFSVGASCPITFRLVSTATTNSTALVGPTESSVFALGNIILDLTYYF